MTTKVSFYSVFKKKLEKLSRKYPLLPKELRKLIEKLKSDERPGDKIPNVGYDVYKVRIKNPSAQKGKSGGFRIIYYVYFVDTVILLSIYSKSELSNLSSDAIRNTIEDLKNSDSIESDSSE